MAPGTDIAVVGAGIVGLSTALALRDRGAAVTVYERGVPGNGQSGGHSRIFRHWHDDPRLRKLARQSRQDWREWEERFGRELLRADGVVVLGPTVASQCEALGRDGIMARLISESELSERLPLLAGGREPALLDEAGGVIRTRTAIELLIAALGRALVSDEVLSVRPTPAGPVELRTGGLVVEHERVVVCAGRGTVALARGAGLELAVRQSAHVRLAFPVRAAPPPRLACLLDRSEAWADTSAYADPLPGNRLYAVGLTDTPVHPDGGLVDADGLASVTARTVDYVARALPGLGLRPVQARHCWVTALPWGHDAFAAWTAGGALFFTGNNLFKHAPTVGRALAATLLGESPVLELGPSERLGAPNAGVGSAARFGAPDGST